MGQAPEKDQLPQTDGGAGGRGMASVLRHLRVWEKRRSLDNVDNGQEKARDTNSR